MLFHHAPYLWLLAATFVGYWGVLRTQRARNLYLLAASVVFYAHGTEFIDYRTRFPDRYFSDHYHLTARGGTLFSHVLASEVLEPRWREAARVRREQPES
jgi:hypothetical protein